MKDLNVRAKTIKLFIENIWEKLHDIGVGNDFLSFSNDTKSTDDKWKDT